MSVAALFTWTAAIFAGLFLLVIWLLEYDRTFRGMSASRLPVPVISAHVLLGVGGLLMWFYYLLADEQRVAWITLTDLGVVAVLGLTMAGRWLRVYRAFASPGLPGRGQPGPGQPGPGQSASRPAAAPPERSFPVPVVIVHGIFAVTTLVLVLVTVLHPSRS